MFTHKISMQTTLLAFQSGTTGLHWTTSCLQSLRDTGDIVIHVGGHTELGKNIHIWCNRELNASYLEKLFKFRNYMSRSTLLLASPYMGRCFDDITEFVGQIILAPQSHHRLLY